MFLTSFSHATSSSNSFVYHFPWDPWGWSICLHLIDFYRNVGKHAVCMDPMGSGCSSFLLIALDFQGFWCWPPNHESRDDPESMVNSEMFMTSLKWLAGFLKHQACVCYIPKIPSRFYCMCLFSIGFCWLTYPFEKSFSSTESGTTT